MSFKTILLSAWKPTQEIQYELFALKVPESWQQVAKSLAERRRKATGKGYSSVPVYSLDPLIAASFPEIIQTARNGWQSIVNFWILSKERVKLDLLSDLIKDWLREEFTDSLGENDVESALNKLNPEAWQWEDKPIIYPQWDNHVCFSAFPDYLASEFLKNPLISFGADHRYSLTFYRVVRLTQGAELMSWPPTQIPVKKGKEIKLAHISLVIRFKLQTIPWHAEPMIFPELSLRRWIDEPLKKFPYKGCTVYIGDNRRWLDGKRQPFCFMPLTLKKRGQEDSSTWPKAITKLMEIDNGILPDPGFLQENPRYNWSNFDKNSRNLQLAIAYDTRHKISPPCLPGVSGLDLACLDEAIPKNLPVERVSLGQRVCNNINFWPTGESKKRGDKTPKDPNELDPIMLRPKVMAPAVFRERKDPLNTILILWETRQCRDALIAEICLRLGLSPQEETTTELTSNGLEFTKTCYQGELGTLWIITQHVGDLTRQLNFDESQKKSRLQKRIELLSKRIDQIKSSLPITDSLSGALVEIKTKTSFFPPDTDPKLGIRIGLAQQKYLNQHIHAVTGYNQEEGQEYDRKDKDHRVKSAVSDLFRQWGILPIPLIDEKKDKVTSNLWLTCFYILRRTRRTTADNAPCLFAIMIRVNPVTGTVEMATTSQFNSQGWVPYSQGLYQLISEKWDENYSFEDNPQMNPDQEDSQTEKTREKLFLNQFVNKCLEECLKQPISEDQKELPHVLFMVEAHNCRKSLTWVQNPKLPANDLPPEIRLKDSETERLWVVRLRTAVDREVPINIVQDSPGSRTTGLFRWENIDDKNHNHHPLYISLRKSLNTEQGILKKEESRLENGGKPSGIARPLEIAIVYSPGIEVTQLASFVHHLRDRWPYFYDEVILPFPFPFAISAKEYAVTSKDTEEKEEPPDED